MRKLPLLFTCRPWPSTFPAQRVLACSAFLHGTVGAALLLLGCDPFHTTFDDIEQARYYTRAEFKPVPRLDRPLRAMTWNIKFGGGRIDFFFDCYGKRVLMQRDEVLTNLAGVARKIRQVDPDILLLQEVDVNSKRSAFIDELQWILDHTHLNYGVYASGWKSDFVPSDGLGAMDSGNAVLSRWPLRDAERVALATRGDQDSLTRYFYLHDNLLRVVVDTPPEVRPQGGLRVVATHTSAYSKDDTKRLQLLRFEAELDSIASEGGWVLGGGDLNTLPPGSAKLKDFDDKGCTDEEYVADDYSAETHWLDGLYSKYAPAVSLSEYDRDNSLYYSHTTRPGGFWNRTLDFLFSSRDWVLGSGMVHQSVERGGMATIPLSDHAPLTGELPLSDPEP